MEGFEPSRRLPDLPHFECGPFSHLGTSPYGVFWEDRLSLYIRNRKRSILFQKKIDVS